MPQVHNVCIKNALPNLDSSPKRVLDLIMINRSAHLQSWQDIRAGKHTQIEVITVTFIFDIAIEKIKPYGVARPVLCEVVQPQSSRWDQARDRHTYRLGRQRAPIVGKLHNQRAVSCGLKPTTVVKGGIVVADTGVVTPKRHLQMVVIVVFEQHTSQVHFKSLRISFTNHNFRENAGLIVDPGSEQ